MPEVIRYCQQCGKPFQRHRAAGKPQVHCSDKCRRAFATQAMNARRLAVRPTVCPECGESFDQPTRGRPRRFCSDQCKRRAHNRALRRRRQPAKQIQKCCPACGETFLPRRRDQDYCSVKCRDHARYVRVRNGGPLRQGLAFTRRCVECGEPFTARKANAKWCSKRCRILTSGRDASRRRGAGVGAVFYTDLEIFERDGWRCHRCHKLVDRNVPRTHPDGASIDHIIPLSLGGIDAPSNVATAHWRCNREKGARGANDQLRLI